MEASKMSLKLLIDAKNNKLLFAEAGKNFVDFLFHLLSLSLGAATRLLRKQEAIGSLENLYHSIENLDEAYIQPDQNKDIFLRPKPPASAPAFQLALLALEDSPEPERIQDKVFYKCSNNCCYSPFGIGSTYVTDDPRALCPNCRLFMTLRMKYVAPPQTGGGDGDSKAGGFAKGVVTYMIMDDLEVKPMSTISSIALLN